MLRFFFLVVIFAVELTLLSLSVDGQTLLSQTGFAAHMLGAWGMPVVRFLVTTAGLAGTFIYLKRRTALESFGQDLKQASARRFPIALHVILFAILVVAGRRLYGTPGSTGGAAASTAMVAAFVGVGVAALLSGLAMIAPVSLWARFARATWGLWACAAGAAAAVQWMTAAWRLLWTPASYVTYQLVQWMVQPLIGRLIIQPERMRIATDRFGVIISPECSGMEGMGLLLLFGALWLWFFRKECRFPQALLLLPTGLAVLFVLNSVRIAALLLIGHAGAPEVATEGFHSQAGWIAFNGVAFGLCIVAGRVKWIAVAPAVAVEEESGGSVNAVAVYLGPFLAILAAGMLARAMTGGFEWMYPLRVAAACAVLWRYRRAYLEMDWQTSWRGPVAGIAVFGVWMAFEWAFAGSPHASAPLALEEAGAASRWSWIAFRILGATAAVPLAEELAFRGYLLRRVVTEDFDRLTASRSTLPALAISSVLFGAMHGSRWLAGTVAGLLYGWAYRQKGQLGDAVVAHAVTNALIAAAVLALGWWKLW